MTEANRGGELGLPGRAGSRKEDRRETHAVFLLAVVALAFPWNAWSGTEPEDGTSASRSTSPSELPASEWLALTTTPEASPENAADETSPTAARPYGYANVATGRCNHGYAILGGGGGGEIFPFRRLGVGVDLGYHQFIDDIGFGVFSFNAALHLGDRTGKTRVDPFLSASPGFYTAGESGSGGAFGVGGGVNYWFHDRVGLHTDVRFAILGTEEAIALFRVGVAFR